MNLPLEPHERPIQDSVRNSSQTGVPVPLKRHESMGLQRKPVHVGVVLKDVLGALEQSDLRQCGRIFVHWAQIVGEPVASHARPWQVRGRKLKVIVDSSDWHYAILSCFDKEILEKVQAWVGKDAIREIRYQVGEV